MAAAPISAERVRLAGIETHLRRREGEGTPTLYVHGNPTHSADWMPFLEASTTPAIALDLPNFGRSERVPADRFDPSMHAYADYLGAAIDQLGLDRFNLVVHDWGAIALHPAKRRAERLGRVVLIDAVPLLAGYRWHWVARIWRTRVLGELFMATASRRATALALRLARPGMKPMPDSFIEMVWSCWDRPMGAAVLRLYRSADPGALEAAGRDLERIACPVLVCWGRHDPYVGPELAPRYAARFPDSELLELDGAGHWPWIDRPELVERVLAFVAGDPG